MRVRLIRNQLDVFLECGLCAIEILEAAPGIAQRIVCGCKLRIDLGCMRIMLGGASKVLLAVKEITHRHVGALVLGERRHKLFKRRTLRILVIFGCGDQRADKELLAGRRALGMAIGFLNCSKKVGRRQRCCCHHEVAHRKLRILIDCLEEHLVRLGKVQVVK